MRGWSISLGRIFGVPVRLHGFFLLLLALMVSHAVLNGAEVQSSVYRGIGLWLIAICILGVREIARALAAAWFGLKLRSVLILPTGGELAIEGSAALTPAAQRCLALIGPITSLFTALLLFSLGKAAAPQIDWTARPWFDAGHLLRAMIWGNVLLGVIHLLPTEPLDGAYWVRPDPNAKLKAQADVRTEAEAVRAAAMDGKAIQARTGLRLAMNAGSLDARLARMIGFMLVAAGVLFANVWVMSMGLFTLFGPQAEPRLARPGTNGEAEDDRTRLRDVMLTEYATLSGSDTLEGALERSVHTLQDVFPVVRGRTIVGSIGRQRIVEMLAVEGNGFVQGVMSKVSPGMQAEAPLLLTLRRLMSTEGAQLLPVMEGDRVVGIVTPQHLAQALRIVEQQRRLSVMRGTAE